ncbi:MAG: D-alanine--D-alanine ligase family protein [Spirochaetota bacterium]|nr:D-alanine--D-alanine ligase family protein [Spirochaetota bacterium]
MIRIGILYGGRSLEHDVSLCSAASVVSAIDKDKYEIIAVGIDRDGKWYVQEEPVIEIDKNFGKVLALKRRGRWFVNHFEDDMKLNLYNLDNNEKIELDVVFPVIHGSFCEDGKIQGLLELAMVPYVGADVKGSVVAMDKDVTKRLLRDANIPVVPWIFLSSMEWCNYSNNVEMIVEELGLPLFVKPSNTGSSVGVMKVSEENELLAAIKYSFTFDNTVIIEKSINCREIECAVLGNHFPEVSMLGEIIPHHEFYSYEAKYIDPDGAELRIPAQISKELADEIRQTAGEAYRILCCRGMARVDFFVEKDESAYYINEINTIPGFTNISMYPKLWESAGLSYSDLIDKLITLAFQSHQERVKIKSY